MFSCQKQWKKPRETRIMQSYLVSAECRVCYLPSIILNWTECLLDIYLCVPGLILMAEGKWKKIKKKKKDLEISGGRTVTYKLIGPRSWCLSTSGSSLKTARFFFSESVFLWEYEVWHWLWSFSKGWCKCLSALFIKHMEGCCSNCARTRI